MADENPVTIRDIDVPFWRIVMILVKWSIASIPALVILMLIGAVLSVILGLILAGLGVHTPEPPVVSP